MRSRVASLSLAVIALVLGTSVALAGSADITVEGGAYFDFVAPDPGGPADGTIRFGFSGPVETIAADAELVPPADTNLAFLGGGTPTCLEVTRQGAAITRLAFVAECVVSGEVILVADVFGPGADGYLIGDRLAAPAEFIATSPQFAALIGVPADAGTILNVTFFIDTDFGFPTTFVGVTTVTGPVSLLDGGDVTVDGATLPSEVIDDAARAALTEAARLGVDATVQITGDGNLQVKSQMPELEITLAVTFSAPAPSDPVAPSAAASLLPDTSAGSTVGGGLGAVTVLVAGLFVTASGTLAAVRVARRHR